MKRLEIIKHDDHYSGSIFNNENLELFCGVCSDVWFKEKQDFIDWIKFEDYEKKSDKIVKRGFGKNVIKTASYKVDADRFGILTIYANKKFRNESRELFHIYDKDAPQKELEIAKKAIAKIEVETIEL